MTNQVASLAGETAPSMLAIGVWLMCLAFFVVLVNGLIKLAARVRGRDPQPPNKQLEAALEAMDRRVGVLEEGQRKLSSELHDMHVELMQTDERRALNLHNRINPLMENTASIKGSMEAFTGTFQQMIKLLEAHVNHKKQS